MVARARDIQIYLHQDNNQKDVIVDAVSAPLTFIHEEMTQELDDILGQSFTQLLPERIVQSIDDYVEFTSDGYDITQVLPKIRRFAFKTSKGEEVAARIRMHHDVAFDEHIHAIMVVYGASTISPQLFRDIMATKDEAHGLNGAISPYAFEKMLKEIILHVAGDALQAVLCNIQIETMDGFEKNEKAITQTITNTIRETDIASYAGDGVYNVMFLETDTENVDKPINRLRKALRDAFEAPITFSATACSIASESTPEELLEACSNAMEHTSMAEQLVVI